MFEDTFSTCNGYTQLPALEEKGTLSKAARTRLWNVFQSDFYGPSRPHLSRQPDLANASPPGQFLRSIWADLWNEPINRCPQISFLMEQIEKRALSEEPWHLLFDIFEELFKQHRPENLLLLTPAKTAENIRRALARQNSAYTFVGGHFVDRMTDAEVQSIEKVLRSPIEGIRDHFTTALQRLSDRESPDYRNSIKESILAVEAACKHLTGLQNATLGTALNQLHSTRPLHPAFKEALSKLYGWTGDEDGIRHAIMESDKIDRADAQFMLVTCSAFVNYLFER
jgi:hypothetical protein